MSRTLPAPPTRHELAVLRSPDRKTAWAIVLSAPLDRAVPPLAGAVAALHRAVPIIGARLHGETWYPGAPPDVITDAQSPATARFDLRSEPPLRIVATGNRLTVVGHHAAFDGRALVAVMSALLGGPLPAPSATEPEASDGPPTRRRPPFGRLLRRADRVASTGSGEVFVARQARLGGARLTARLAAAAVAAAGEHNASRGASWQRVAVTLGVGGSAGVGNTATYRRFHWTPDDDAVGAAMAALASSDEPVELVRAPKALMLAARLVAGHLSDSLLVSNVGPAVVPGATALEFYPVAHGRSAVAIGAAGITGGDATVTLRSLHLDRPDAERLLDRTIELLPPPEVG